VKVDPGEPTCTIGPPPPCYLCKHLNRDWPLDPPWQCKAFPGGIPKELLHSWPTAHTEPYPGDNGIMFEQEPGFPPPLGTI
jgi:hypothetical protein